MRKKGTKNKVYSPEFKTLVVETFLNEKLGYNETVKQFNLGNTNNGGAIQMLHRWERIYLEEGANGLMKERRGRKPQNGSSNVGRPPKIDPKVEKDLIAEIQQLRMENEYLKKLQALVQERVKRENQNKRR